MYTHNLNSKTKILVIAVCLLVFGFNHASANVSDQLLELSKRIQELTAKEEQLKSGIVTKQQEAVSLARDINVLNAQILRLQTSIRRTENEITSTTLQIQQVRKEIFDVEDVLVEKKALITALLRELNEVDNKNLTAILLSSDSISEVFDEIEYVNNIGGNIVVTLQQLRETKEELMEKEGLLSGKKVEAERLSVQYQSNQASLSGTKNSKDYLLTATKGKEEEYKNILSEVEREKAKFFEELKQLESNARNEGIFIVSVDVPIPPKQKIFSWPEDDYYFTQGYGYTAFARRGAYGGAAHNGIDMSSGEGTFIKSIGDGKALAKGHSDGWGNWAAIQHNNGLVSLYGHMQAPSFLAIGSDVRTGDVVGYEGKTGNSTGSHLHLSLYHEFFTYINARKNNQVYFNYFDGTLNPLDYLKD